MTITSTPPTAPADVGRRRIGAALEALARGSLAAFDAAWDQRQLHHLSEHMLRDVGLIRDQIRGKPRASAGRRENRQGLLLG